MNLGDMEKPKETMSECQHHLDLFRKLLDEPAWALFCRYLNDSAGYVESAFLHRPIAPDFVLEQEYLKGRADALRKIPLYLAEYCETLEGNIKRIISMMKHEEEEQQNAGHDRTFDYRASNSVNGSPADDSASESFPVP